MHFNRSVRRHADYFCESRPANGPRETMTEAQTDQALTRLTSDEWTSSLDLTCANDRCPTVNIEVAGHTDSDGEDAANQALSEKRAQAVADYLVKAGLPANRFTAVGYGSAQPIASNDTEDGKAQNRRIEFTVK
jgi:hypothetical protein